MTIKKRKSSSSFPLKEIALFLFPLFNLLVLYIIKYRNQALPLAEFKLGYTGNLLNLFFVIVLLVEFIILPIRLKGGLQKVENAALKISVVQLAFLIVSGLLLSFEIHISHDYFLGFAVSKIFIWFFFFGAQFLQFLLISYVRLIIIKSASLLYLRTFLNSIIIALFLYCFGFVYSLGTYPVTEKNEPNGTVCVVLGAAVWSNNVPSTILMERLNKAQELYEKKKIQKIQLTGGNAPGELSEAEVAFNYLTKFPVNPKDVWLEKKTTSTTEQVRFIKNELMKKKKLSEIVVISDRFHLKRINEISKFYNIKIKLCGSRVTLNSKRLIYYKLREGIALINFWFFAI